MNDQDPQQAIPVLFEIITMQQEAFANLLALLLAANQIDPLKFAECMDLHHQVRAKIARATILYEADQAGPEEEDTEQ